MESQTVVKLLLVAMVTRSCHGDQSEAISDTIHSTLQTDISEDKPVRNEQTMSLVLNTHSQSDFIRFVQLPRTIEHMSQIQVEYFCGMRGIAGVELRVWSAAHSNHSIFSHSWSCTPYITTPLRKKMLIWLPDEFAYKPSVVNPVSHYAHKLLLQAFLLDEKIVAKKPKDKFEAAVIRVMNRVKLLPPLSRPHRPIRECLTWWTELGLELPYTPKCPLEPVEYKLLTFPVVFSHGKAGVHRVLNKHKNPVLEQRRLEARSNAKFTFVVWLYVVEWCEAGRLCSVLQHLTWDDFYMTPVILINHRGKLHVQIATEDGRPMAFLTNDFSVPKHQWVRLMIRCNEQKFEVDALYGPNLDKTFNTWFRFGAVDIVYLDHALGVFAVGGTEMNQAFKGMVGSASYYREYMSPQSVRVPDPSHPMFQLSLAQHDLQCNHYRSWVKYRIQQCRDMLRTRLKHESCAHFFEDIFHARVNYVFTLPQCTAHDGLRYAHYKHVNQLIKRCVYRQGTCTEMDIGKQLYDDSRKLIEDRGLVKTRSIIQLLQQASCHGYHDASFMLAAIYSKGVVVKADEIKAVWYLMQGAVEGHRLCMMSLGNKHTHGLDGLPADLEIAYAYYKHVGDVTKWDREKHLETDVFTEQVRLTDEDTLGYQTQEDGDLFHWFKHQASQGVISAQQNLGRLLFWGSQGVRRDLRQAAEFYRMGAENGDAQSMHDYGICLLKGQGVATNETLAKEWLEQAAEKGHVNAQNALGWFALEREHNYTKALEYFLLAHEHGNPDAAYNIAHMLQFGRLANKTVDKVNAFPYFAAGASRGQLDAALMVAQANQRGHPLTPRDTYIALDWVRFVSEQNPAVGSILHSGLKAYTSMNWAAALLYYIMAAETGVEVGNFNLAHLCEENVEGVVTQLQKECIYTHYNLSTKRYAHQVDPYASIKMGDYYWYGCGGEIDHAKAADYYCNAALRSDPHALFNLGFMVEEGAQVPTSVWYRLGIEPDVYHNNAQLLAELYFRCSESYKSEAYIPCSISLFRVQLTHLWQRYHLLLKLTLLLMLILSGLVCAPAVHNYLHESRAATGNLV